MSLCKPHSMSLTFARSTSAIRFYTLRDIDRHPFVDLLSSEQRETIKVVGHVLPFRVNSYVVDELIEWSRVPDDPIFRLTFPQAAMLPSEARARMARALSRGDTSQIRAVADGIRRQLNRIHPGNSHTTFRRSTGRSCRAFSTSTPRHAWCFPRQARPAMRSARSAFAGRNSWECAT